MNTEESVAVPTPERRRPFWRTALRYAPTLLSLTALNQVRESARLGVVLLTAFMFLISLGRAALAVSAMSRAKQNRTFASGVQFVATRRLLVAAIPAAAIAWLALWTAVSDVQGEPAPTVVVVVVTLIWLVAEVVAVPEQQKVTSPSLIVAFGLKGVVDRLLNSLPGRSKRGWTPLVEADRIAAPIFYAALGAILLSVAKTLIPDHVTVAQIDALFTDQPKPTVAPSPPVSPAPSAPSGPAAVPSSSATANASSEDKADDVCGYAVEPKLKSLVHPDVKQAAWIAYIELGAKVLGCPDGRVERQNGLEVIVLTGRTTQGGLLVTSPGDASARAVYPSLTPEVQEFVDAKNLAGVGERVDTGVTVHQWYRLADGSCRLATMGYGRHPQVLLDGPTTFVVVTAALRIRAMPFVVENGNVRGLQEYDVSFAYSKSRTTVRVAAAPSPRATDTQFGIEVGPEPMCPDLLGFDALAAHVKQRNDLERAARSGTARRG